MTDKLRELAERWKAKAGRLPVLSAAGITCRQNADELLEILDAQPVRSGGVSDEQAEAMRWALHHIETGNLPIGWNYDRIREAFAAIKSQGESNV